MSLKDPWAHTLVDPIQTPTDQITELKFPRMKGKYMRKFQMMIDQGKIEAARAGEEVGASMQFSYDQFMTIGEAMLADVHGAITARIIMDEMGPEDVNVVVAKLGERFGGGQTTGKTD